MSDLVVIAFPTEAAAEEVRKKLLDMQGLPVARPDFDQIAPIHCEARIAR